MVTFGRSGSWLDDQTAAENITSSNAGSKTRAHRVGRLRPAEPGLGDLGVRRLHGRVLDQLERGQLVLVLLGGGDRMAGDLVVTSTKVAGNAKMSVVTYSKSGRAPGPPCARWRCGTSSTHGFEAASVPAIAAEVGVTERTFYRHFATKDEVLFDDVVEGLAWFGAALRDRPADEDLVRSVLASLGSAPDRPAADGRDRPAAHGAAQPEPDRAGLPGPAGRDGPEVRALLVERGDRPARRRPCAAEVVAGAVFAALAVWTEAPRRTT